MTHAEAAYQSAREQYAALGVDSDAALAVLAEVPISVHCWQADDVAGFESAGATLAGGGIQVTGNYPGRARNVAELRADLDAALALAPGRHRVNLHAIYGEFGASKVERDAIGPEHFAGWIDWAKERGLGLDFNATCFSHPLAADGFTLASADPGVRAFWQRHVARCRQIGEAMGRALGTPCLHNLWIPDGTKDDTAQRIRHRRWLAVSLDAIYADRRNRTLLLDAVESKLFGIGSESFVVGSHDFYMNWTAGPVASAQGVMPCLDMGHYHPTESVADKVSAILPFRDELLVHVSRGVRWDSDHVVTFTDELRALMREIVRAEATDRVHLALDYFDGSINRVGAYVTGIRATQKALLEALLEPTDALQERELTGDGFGRLALAEEAAAMPLGVVWDAFCRRQDVPVGTKWIDAVLDYERRVLSARD